MNAAFRTTPLSNPANLIPVVKHCYLVGISRKHSLMANNPFDFEPVKFLRIHSKNKDDADIQTQVWSCAIEPDDGKSYYPGALTVATCGGNSVCFVDCNSGTVISKYYTKNQRISLFSLAWTTLLDKKGRRSVLAVGGSQSTLFFFDSSEKLCVLEEEFASKRTVIINSLCFHPTEKQILFCGSSDGMVRVCELQKEIDDNSRPKYSLQLNQSFTTDSEVYDLSFCLTTKYLLSSCDEGLNCFSFPSKESLRLTSSKQSGKKWVKLNVSGFKGRQVENHRSGRELVDSVRVLKDGLIACKYALHGCIYICDLNVLVASCKQNSQLLSIDVEPLYTLTWSDTDNYFMYMDANIGCGMLCCGDDRGALWFYDLSSLLSENSGRKQSLDSYSEEVLPSAILPWPTVTDRYNEKKRKLNLDKYDIVVDRVAVHSSGCFLIAVTNNNLVCLWRRASS